MEFGIVNCNFKEYYSVFLLKELGICEDINMLPLGCLLTPLLFYCSNTDYKRQTCEKEYKERKVKNK